MNKERKTLWEKPPLAELNLTDRFLFAGTMDDPGAYEAAVSILLENEIKLKGVPQTEKELRVSPALRSVRLDVVSMDEEGKLYFTEMQKTDTGNLFKRTRYYQAQMDVSLLEAGDTDFNRLNDSCMILVAPFDLFDYGLYRYTFAGQCQEIPGLMLKDGATRIFINTFGRNREDFSQEFLDFMEYINDTRGIVASQSESARLRLIHNRVESIRRSEKWGIKYMQRWEELGYARDEGVREGREEGREEGRAEGYRAGQLSGLVGMVVLKLRKGKEPGQIAEELEQEPEQIAAICRAAEKYAPGYEADAVCQEIMENAKIPV